jgi:hypothetical protein
MPKYFMRPELTYKESQLYRHYGATSIGELRIRFGPLFARPCNENVALREVWDNLDYGSIRQLILDVEEKQ